MDWHSGVRALGDMLLFTILTHLVVINLSRTAKPNHYHHHHIFHDQYLGHLIGLFQMHLPQDGMGRLTVTGLRLAKGEQSPSDMVVWPPTNKPHIAMQVPTPQRRSGRVEPERQVEGEGQVKSNSLWVSTPPNKSWFNRSLGTSRHSCVAQQDSSSLTVSISPKMPFSTSWTIPKSDYH